MKKRIYVCHTFYHVYIAYLKEFFIRETSQGTADVLLSTMSNDFGNLKERMEQVGFFTKVIRFEEKNYTTYPQLLKYKKDTKNLIFNLINRIIFTKKFGKLTGRTIPVDFECYDDIYVFCDSDPIGYYLNYRKIYYHAVEDGLNCLKNYDTSRFDNRGHFSLKAKLSSWNLIFIQNGYGKYCLDMEVNQISEIQYPCEKYIELSRKDLFDRIQDKEKEILLTTFLSDYQGLKRQLEQEDSGIQYVLILSEPLCTLDVREKIFRDLIDTYGNQARVFIKQHPRDLLDYETLFPEVMLLSRDFPMEMLNFFTSIKFQKIVSVFTELGELKFGEEKIRLGKDFMDHYEEPLIHRQNEQIY